MTKWKKKTCTDTENRTKESAVYRTPENKRWNLPGKIFRLLHVWCLNSEVAAFEDT